MRDTYIPLFASTLDSSLWSLDGNCLKVFLTLALKADPEGYVSAAIDGVARAAALPVAEVIQHLKRLEGPDEFSKDLARSPANGGRRLERVAGGWRVINIEWYREEARRQAELARKRRWWDDKGSSARRDARRTETQTETETQTYTETEMGSGEGGGCKGDAPAVPPAADAAPQHPLWNDTSTVEPERKPKRRRSELTECPSDFAPNASHATAASKHRVNLTDAFEHFMAHHSAKGSKFKNWDMALHGWIIRQKSFGATRVLGAGTDDRHQRQADRVRMLREQEAEEERRSK